ncbi:hypothetical protein, partial [Ralstonia pseudosolanacearum]|uniref:hypothetical protein n=1 Tax=Ralstonia pseudosolanacearum TaxID=1310165 RepID=UPI003CF381F3
FAATVEASGTTTVNGSTYAGTTDLTIDTTAESSTLQSGTITLNAANDSAQATNDTSALTVESGTISATATGGKFTQISGLDTGESFTFGGKTYTQTAIGLTDGTTLNTAVTTSVNVADLTAGQTIWQAPSGALTLSDETGASWLVADVDTSNPSAAVNYGTLTKTDGVYSFTQATAPSSITVEGVKVELPSECGQIPLTALGALFTVTADGDFTIDATSTLTS